MNILISEEALQNGTGHWPGYIGGIASGLRKAGDNVDILVHKECVPDLCASLEATPLFTRNCWLDPASQGGFGGLRHNYIFGKELRSWISSRSTPYDLVCGLTMRLQHLLAFARMSRSGKVPKSTNFLLLFVQGFGRYDAGIGQSVFPRNSSTLLARICFRIMAPAVRSGRVTLAAETKGMQEELKRFSGLPVSLFPHPVPPPANAVEAAPSPEMVTLTCPGFARHEKGTDLLQEAILMLIDDETMRHVRFILQWPSAFDLPDGRLLEPDPVLLDHPMVIFRNENLNSAQYEEMLQESDIILLPYRRESYHNRVSRVAIEGAGRGKPLVYMSGTWSEEVAEITKAGVPVEEESAESLVAAIRQSVMKLNSLKQLAEGNSEKLIHHHSVARFRELVQEVVAR